MAWVLLNALIFIAVSGLVLVVVNGLIAASFSPQRATGLVAVLRDGSVLTILTGIFQLAFGLLLARMDIWLDAGRLHVSLR